MQIGRRRAIGLQIGEQGLVEALQLLLAPLQQPLPFLVLGGGRGGGLGVLLGDGDGVAAGQLPHRLREGQPLAVLDPADRIGPPLAHEALHPVALGADAEGGMAIVVPGAVGDERAAGALQGTGGEALLDAGPGAHRLDQRGAQHRWAAVHGTATPG